MSLNILTASTVTCCTCSFQFAVDSEVLSLWKETHKRFHCPACDGALFYPAKSDMEIAKEKLDAANRRIEFLSRIADNHLKDSESMKRSRDALRGVVTRMKKGPRK